MAISYDIDAYDQNGNYIPPGDRAVIRSRRDRVRICAVILAELWDAVHGDVIAIQTIYHAGCALRNFADEPLPVNPRGDINMHMTEPLPARYEVASEALKDPMPAYILGPKDRPKVGPEATLLRDALRFLTR